jgi:hypothetical protein
VAPSREYFSIPHHSGCTVPPTQNELDQQSYSFPSQLMKYPGIADSTTSSLVWSPLPITGNGTVPITGNTELYSEQAYDPADADNPSAHGAGARIPDVQK